MPHLVGALGERRSSRSPRRRRRCRRGRARRAVACSEKSAKLTPLPSQVAPSGYGVARPDAQCHAVELPRRAVTTNDCGSVPAGGPGAQGAAAVVAGVRRVEQQRRPELAAVRQLERRGAPSPKRRHDQHASSVRAASAARTRPSASSPRRLERVAARCASARLARAAAQEIAVEREHLPSAVAPRSQASFAAAKRLLRLRVGRLPVQPNAANSRGRPCAHRLDQLRVAVARRSRGTARLAVLLAHEQQRHVRREQHGAAASAAARRPTSVRSAARRAARLPTWSWFCAQTTNRWPAAAPASAPWRRPR